MGEFFPEIKSQQQLVTNVIREEEASSRTLDQGLQLLDKVRLAVKHLNCMILGFQLT
jgi:alanyl-tRNA synthetase